MDNHEVKVNVYIETSHTGPAKRKMAGGWIVEYQLRSGKPVTRGGILYEEITMENELVLNLIREAFSILTKTCCVRVFTKCSHVLNTMNNHWLWQWQKNHWMNAKGKLINNADTWKECAELMEKHTTEWTDENHAYSMCMQARIHKELSAAHEFPKEGGFTKVPVPEWNTR